MKRWAPAVLCVASGVLAASALAGAQARPPLSTADPSDIASGKRIFDAQCAWCHGTDGAGGTGPTLQGAKLKRAAADAALIGIVRSGIPGTEMPSFEISLTDRTAWQTAAYVLSLGRLPVQPLPGSPERGAAVFQSRGCATCHIVAGRGAGFGPELTTIGAVRGPASLRESVVAPDAAQSPGYLVVRAITRGGTTTRGHRINEDVFWVHIRDVEGRLHTFEKKDLSALERELKGTLMPSYEALLSPAELDDLVAYLASLRGER